MLGINEEKLEVYPKDGYEASAATSASGTGNITASSQNMSHIRDHPLSTYTDFPAFLDPLPPLYAFWPGS